MDQPETIEPQPGHVLIMHEMHPLHAEVIVLVPVPAYGQYFIVALGDGNDVGESYSRLFFILVDILEPLKVQVHMHFQKNGPGITVI